MKVGPSLSLVQSGKAYYGNALAGGVEFLSVSTVVILDRL